MKKRAVCAAAALLVFCSVFMALPVNVQAASQVSSVDITVELQQDGSAVFTEVWDMTVDRSSHGNATELYIQKPNLGGRVISGFTVTDENGTVFEDVGQWDTSLSRSQKAGRSGLVQTNGGYELCWGFGEFGRGIYTLRYTMTNAVQRYTDADAFYLWLVPQDVFGGPQKVTATIFAPGVEFTKENTGVWAFGFSVNFGVQNGKAVFESDRALNSNEYVSVLLEFKQGMFAPLQTINRGFDSLLEEAKQGSSYKNEEASSSDTSNGLIYMAAVLIPILIMGSTIRKSSGRTRKKALKPEYKNPEYCRELPFGGSLVMTYSVLENLGQSDTDSGIIGAYMLRWIRSHQVEILVNTNSRSGESSLIRMYGPRPDLNGQEAALYQMFLEAAGSDYILQPKEFEKWSRTNYTRIQNWMVQLKNTGMEELRANGFADVVDVKSFLGLFNSRETVMNQLGESMTVKMFGFKRFLEEFTIINERQAREVQLWDEYLVFAQMFGIAEKVAEQFKQLYPDYFRQWTNDTDVNISAYDIMVIASITNRYSHAMHNGYRAGYNAANRSHSSVDSGGGGHYSGGGGFSGGGGGGGGGAR